MYESFILNFFHGLSLPILDVVCAVITKMWNVIINIVTPKGVFKKFHNQDDRRVNIVIVWNNIHGDHAHYTATKVDNPDWRPMRGVDWAGDVKKLHNVRNAATNVEKFYRKRTANKILADYESVSDSIVEMKSDLLNMHNEVQLLQNQIESINQKIHVWAGNVYKMEGRQGMLRAKLLDLGVDVEKISEKGFMVPDFHKIISQPTPQKKPMQTVSDPTTQETTLQQKPSQTVSRIINPTIGGQFNLKTFNPQVNLVRLSSTTISIAEGQIREKEVVDTESTPIVKIESTPTVNITSTSQQSDVEPMDTTESETIPKDKPTTETDATESTPQDDLLVTNSIEPDLSVVKTVAGDNDENQNMTFWLPPQQQVSITPYATPSTTQSQAASQLVPHPSAVYLAQQTAQRVGQQPAKVSVTPQGQSIRWGKVLKGQLTFLCS